MPPKTSKQLIPRESQKNFEDFLIPQVHVYKKTLQPYCVKARLTQRLCYVVLLTYEELLLKTRGITVFKMHFTKVRSTLRDQRFRDSQDGKREYADELMISSSSKKRDYKKP